MIVFYNLSLYVHTLYPYSCAVTLPLLLRSPALQGVSMCGLGCSFLVSLTSAVYVYVGQALSQASKIHLTTAFPHFEDMLGGKARVYRLTVTLQVT